MPWSETTPMDQKTQFIADYLRQTLTMSELCQLYGISRKTGYKIVDRYLRHGPAGLEEQSRRPSNNPNQTPEHVVQALIALRQRHPSWGAKKLLPLLEKRHPGWELPARTTVCDILSREGLVRKKRARRADRSSGQARYSDLGTQRRMERGLQGPFQDRRWFVLLSADHHRWLQSLSVELPGAVLNLCGRRQASVHARIQRVRPAQAYPHRQRRAVRHHHTGTALGAVSVVGTPGDFA